MLEAIQISTIEVRMRRAAHHMTAPFPADYAPPSERG